MKYESAISRGGNKRLTAATLPVVLVISVLMLLMILLVYSLWEMNFLHYSLYLRQKQQEENLNSAITLYSNDSTFLNDYNDEKMHMILDDDTTSTVRCIVKQWGLYESIRVWSNNNKFSTIKLLGKEEECQHRAALWLCDRNRALSLSGKTEVRGTRAKHLIYHILLTTLWQFQSIIVFLKSISLSNEQKQNLLWLC